MIVIGVHHIQPAFSGIAATLILALEILLVRVDIGIAIIYGRTNPLLQKSLYYRTATGSTASMKEKFQAQRITVNTLNTANAITQATTILFTAPSKVHPQLPVVCFNATKVPIQGKYNSTKTIKAKAPAAV